MTRSEAIAKIEATLTSLSDADVVAIASIVEQLKAARQGIRALTPREMQLIEQSKADFRDGRTSSLQESEAYVVAELARRRAQRSTA